MTPSPQPPIEKAIINILLDGFGLDQTHGGSIVPDEFPFPFFCVTRLGGPRGKLTDSPVLDLDVYDATPGAARVSADTADELLSGQQRVRFIAVDDVKRIIDDCFCNKQPSRMPWDGLGARYGATYALTLRRL